jgi:hypothetical protein
MRPTISGTAETRSPFNMIRNYKLRSSESYQPEISGMLLNLQSNQLD